MTTPALLPEEITLRRDARGMLDEIVAKAASVQLERLDNHLFSLVVVSGARRLVVNIGTPATQRRNVNAQVFSDDTLSLPGVEP